MRIDSSKAIGAYAAVVTMGLAFVLLTGLSQGQSASFREINVERINVREPNGTLRMTISNHARMPGIIDGAREYPHPNRPEAGMIFFNDEGTENGGLVFNGKMAGGKATNGGSLSFDRYHQDQTVQMTTNEDGPERSAGVFVNDHPDGLIDFAAIERISKLPAGEAQTAAVHAANLGSFQRAFLGRSTDKSASLVLRDALGRKRLVLSVSESGAAVIQFLDANGAVVHTVN
jgi:hypothetical protein